MIEGADWAKDMHEEAAAAAQDAVAEVHEAAVEKPCPRTGMMLKDKVTQIVLAMDVDADFHLTADEARPLVSHILKVAESDLADDNDELLEFCTMTGDQRVLRVLKLMEPEDIDQWYRDHVETKDWHDDLHEEASAAAQDQGD